MSRKDVTEQTNSTNSFFLLMTYTNRNKGSKMNDFMLSNENTPDVDNMRIVFSALKSQMDVLSCSASVQTKLKTKEQLQTRPQFSSFHFSTLNAWLLRLIFAYSFKHNELIFPEQFQNNKQNIKNEISHGVWFGLNVYGAISCSETLNLFFFAASFRWVSVCELFWMK